MQVLCLESEFYDRTVPSKQNILCQRQSALEIIRSSKDFKQQHQQELKQSKLLNFTDKIRNLESFDLDGDGRVSIGGEGSADGKGVFRAPKFEYVLASESQRYILVLDISKSMGAEGGIRWREIRNGLFRFFAHVPLGSEVGIVTFGAKARVNIAPTRVTEGNREGLYGKIPFRLVEAETGCIECGIATATDLLSSRPGNGAIILVTATEVKQMDAKKAKTVEELLPEIETNSVPLYNLAFGEVCSDIIPLTLYGATYQLAQDESKLLQNMADVFLSILNKHSAPKTHIKKTYEKRYYATSEKILNGNFVVEESLNNNLWMVLTSPFKEDVELFEVTSPSGVKYVFPKYQNGLVYFRRPGVNEIGIWSYRARLYPMASNGASVTVEVIAENTGTDSVDLRGWTNVDSVQGVNALEKEVIIYARLYQGSLPIRNAQVVATIQRPGSSKSVEVVLQDEGTGYPDITKGDGIYSAYFVDFTTEPGLYSLTIKATHDSGRATIPKPSAVKVTDCCGSALAESMYSIPTRSFQQLVAVPSFKVTQGIQYFIRSGEPQINDIFPPSRVTDFSVMSYVNQTLYASLAWSAPGGDFNQGKAAKYEIRCYTNQEALSEANFENMGIDVHESLLPIPTIYGTQQTATVGLPWANEVFFYGLVAIDDSGNRSPVSNLIPVYAAEVSTTTNASIISNTIEGIANLDNALSSAVLEAIQSNPTVYIIAGVVCGIILILVLLISLSIYRSRKRAAEKRRSSKQRTQTYVNDIETPCPPTMASELPDLAPEKDPGNYGGVWTTPASSGHMPGSHSPASDDYSQEYNMYKQNNQMANNVLAGNPSVLSEQASWAYLSSSNVGPSAAPIPQTAAPVHEYRSPFPSNSEDTMEVPHYQNWTCKPPSDNGTATTSSTECSTYESDQSDKNNLNKTGGRGHRHTPAHRHHSLNGEEYHSHHSNKQSGPSSYQSGLDPATLSLSPSFMSEKRRRQESLV